MKAPCHKKQNAAFTLIELLGVVGIIAILLGIILSAIEAVHRYSRKTVAQVEVRSIAQAWERYYDHYNRWPTNTAIKAYVASMSEKDTYHTYIMDNSMGAAMEGRINGDDVAKEINPDAVHFIEFSRFAADGDSYDDRTPVNPWYRGENLSGIYNITAKETPPFLYLVRFDVNANGLISLGNLDEDFPASLKPSEGSNVSRSVIVWTRSSTNDFITSWAR